MRRRAVVGVALAVALLVASTQALRTSEVSDLQLSLARPTPLVVDSVHENRIRGHLGPPTLAARVRMFLDDEPLRLSPEGDGDFSVALPGRGPGLHFLNWQVTYGERWKREATLSLIEGPFAVTEDSTGCNAYVTVSQRFLDDGIVNGGTDLATALQPLALERINSELAKAAMEQGVLLPSARAVRIGFILVDNGILVNIDVPDFFWMSATIGLSASADRLGLEPYRIGKIERGLYPYFRNAVAEAGRGKGGGYGALGGGLAGCALGPMGCLLGALLGESVGSDYGEKVGQAEAEKTVETSVDDRVVPELAAFLRLPDGINLGGGDAGASVRVTICDDVAVTPGDRISLGLGVRVQTRASRTVPGLLGPVELGGALPSAPARADLTLYAAPDLLNALLYGVWQSGDLRRFLSSERSRQEMNSRLSDLSTEVMDIDPVLPPVLLPGTDRTSFELRAGEVMVTLGEKLVAGKRTRVVLSAAAALSFPVLRTTNINVSAALSHLHLSCVSAAEQVEVRAPCFSDLLALASDELRGPDGAPVMNMTLRLSDLVERMQPSPRARLRVAIRDVALEAVRTAATPWLGLNVNVQFERP